MCVTTITQEMYDSFVYYVYIEGLKLEKYASFDLYKMATSQYSSHLENSRKSSNHFYISIHDYFAFILNPRAN